MEIFVQNSYAQPDDPQLIKSLADEALVIHRKAEDNRYLVVFAHGGGSRYGEDSTWGFFPKFLFEDLPQLDVGLYEYRTLLGRAKFWKSVSLSDEAEAFADIIRDIGQYQTIFLVGHSMGGLLGDRTPHQLKAGKGSLPHWGADADGDAANRLTTRGDAFELVLEGFSGSETAWRLCHRPPQHLHEQSRRAR